ncbi:hypothetical protein Q0590_34930 [Rhodocytophaga aerolata]|uniref:Uncharacterized protein n=1 Tax=Rhodocytophaga aerolata TaxID=455078 RepID=A0ABT8RHF0_9BACT|nr:hypothetical protein [Rhodocytophaga aerolata]MDO1451520.1 hypothetical protein [Rhodocytophaga aerolata]
MKTEKLSQQVLLELLTREIETLQKASKVVNQVVPLVKDQIDRLEKRPLVAQVDTAPLEAFHHRVNTQLSRGILMPRWMMGSLIGIVAWALLMTALSVLFYVSKADYKQRAEYWAQKAYDLEQELAQPKPDLSKGKKK